MALSVNLLIFLPSQQTIYLSPEALPDACRPTTHANRGL